MLQLSALAAEDPCQITLQTSAVLKFVTLFRLHVEEGARSGTIHPDVVTLVEAIGSCATADTQEVEGMNSIIKHVIRRSPAIALPLLSARVTGKKFLALHAGQREEELLRCIEFHDIARTALQDTSRFALCDLDQCGDGDDHGSDPGTEREKEVICDGHKDIEGIDEAGPRQQDHVAIEAPAGADAGHSDEREVEQDAGLAASRAERHCEEMDEQGGEAARNRMRLRKCAAKVLVKIRSSFPGSLASGCRRVIVFEAINLQQGGLGGVCGATRSTWLSCFQYYSTVHVARCLCEGAPTQTTRRTQRWLPYDRVVWCVGGEHQVACVGSEWGDSPRVSPCGEISPPIT